VPGTAPAPQHLQPGQSRQAEIEHHRVVRLAGAEELAVNAIGSNVDGSRSRLSVSRKSASFSTTSTRTMLSQSLPGVDARTHRHASVDRERACGGLSAIKLFLCVYRSLGHGLTHNRR
jgi:hypothetical protein